MLGGEGAGPPGGGRSDRSAQGNVGSFLVHVKNLVLTHPHRNSSKIAQVTKPPPTKPKPSDHDTTQKSEGGGGGVIVPYDMGAPPPVQTSQPPLNAGGNERPAHKLVQAVGGGTTNEPPQRLPTSADSTCSPSFLLVDPKPIDR